MDIKQLTTNGLPINPDLINTSTNSIEYKNQLNLTLIINQSESQIANHLNLLEHKVNTNPINVNSLNWVLESYLYTLLTTTTTTTLDNSTSSSYYNRRKKIDPYYFEECNGSYLEKLTYTNYKPWGSKAGSLGYYLYLSQSNIHYANPSTLIRNSVKTALKELNLNSYVTTLLNLIESDDQLTDIQLYKASSSILKELEFIKVLSLLSFLEEWVSELLNWYSKVSDNPENKCLSKTSEYLAFNLLVNISQQILRVGLSNISLVNLQYKFLHQEIELPTLEALDLVINLRKSEDFDITNSMLTDEETLCKKLFDNLSILTPPSFVTQESYRLLLEFPYKGGMNFWLTLVASELINKAYILTHKTRTSYSNNLISPLDKSTDFFKYISRVYKLIFYSGYCLKKTNLDHLEIIGSNLRVLSQLDSSTDIKEYNLLT